MSLLPFKSPRLMGFLGAPARKRIKTIEGVKGVKMGRLATSGTEIGKSVAPVRLARFIDFYMLRIKFLFLSKKWNSFT